MNFFHSLQALLHLFCVSIQLIHNTAGIFNYTMLRVLSLAYKNRNIDPFLKRNRLLVHNDGFPKFEALYCSLNMVS